MELNRGNSIEVRINGFAFGGKGIAKIPTEQGFFTVFVENTFPGQLVRARITKKKKNYAECSLLEVIEKASVEAELPYQQISGAPYLFAPIELQKQYKLESTLELYKRLAHLSETDALFDEWIASPNSFFYRNKMEYSFSSIEHDIYTGEEKDDAFALGFKHRGTWWKVENLDRASGMFDEEWESKLHEVRTYLQQTGLKAWRPPKKEGFFRHIVVRKSFYQDQLLVNLVTSSENNTQFDVDAFGAFLKRLFGERIAGFQHTCNDNVADRAKIENGTWRLIFGTPVIVEKLSGLSFEISMESFFQTNPACAEKLYGKALDYCLENNDLDGKVILDLFCGTGTIGQLLAARTNNAQIIGVDIVPEAIEDAKRNAARNGMENLIFFASDVGKFLKQYPDYENKISALILDPPRAGIAPKTLQKVIDLKAERIVYISCNPATQARDTELLIKSGYQPDRISLVDQFPHTGHVEAIMRFNKKN